MALPSSPKIKLINLSIPSEDNSMSKLNERSPLSLSPSKNKTSNKQLNFFQNWSYIHPTKQSNMKPARSLSIKEPHPWIQPSFQMKQSITLLLEITTWDNLQLATKMLCTPSPQNKSKNITAISTLERILLSVVLVTSMAQLWQPKLMLCSLQFQLLEDLKFPTAINLY